MNRRWAHVAAIVLGLLLAVLPVVAASGEVVDDYWYLVEIQGKKCGHLHAWTVKEGQRFTSHSEMVMSVKRGESVIPVALSSEFVETADAKPVKMRSETKLGTMPKIDDYVFRDGMVHVIHHVAGTKQTETLPPPDGEWMTPVAMGKHIETKIAAGEKEISVRMIDPTAGLKPARLTMTLVEKVPLEVVGKTVPAMKWTAKNDMVPNVESVEYTDEKGVSLRSENDMGGIKVTWVRADKAVALAKADPPELLESTFIRPDKPIRGPRELRTGEYSVSSSDVPIGEWPSAGSQVVTKVDEHTVKVRVEAKRASVVPAGEVDKAEFRRPSSMVNSEDAEVVRLRARGIAGHEKESGAVRAEALRKFVFHFIAKKNFDVGFASAAETARTACGDCSEHAVLLCAMLRADGTPARCVSGLVYVEGPRDAPGKGFFGYHMWTQAMLAGEEGKLMWTDLDAAISETAPMDATHLAIKGVSLADGETVNALMEILPTLGKLRVKVGEVTK